MLSVSIPRYLSELAQALAATNSSDSTVVCTWLGLPLSENCPTPGQARNWSHDDWSKWAGENGFIYDAERTHCFSWHHKVIPTIIFSVSKTPGDFRAPMAIATQIRRTIREISMSANIVVRAILMTDEGKPIMAACSDEFTFRQKILTLITTKEGESLRINSNVAAGLLHDPKDSGTYNVGKVRAMLARCSEYSTSPRAVLQELYGTDEGNRTYEQIKMLPDDHPMTKGIYENVKDHLELLKEGDRAERETRQAERAAREKEREAAQAAKVKVPTQQETCQQLVDQTHYANQKLVDTLIATAEHNMRQAGSFLDRCRLARQNLAKATIPGIEDVAPLKAEVASLGQQLALVTLEKDAGLVRIGELEAEAVALRESAVDSDTITKLTNDKTALLAVVGLIGDAYLAVQKAGPFEIVRILEDLSNNAKEALKNHG